MKPSEWLFELDSHDIYDYKQCAADFKTKTGLEPSWPSYTIKEMKRQIDDRGLGGNVSGKRGQLMCNGWEIAEGVANKYAPNVPRMSYYGRGRNFREAIHALVKAGL